MGLYWQLHMSGWLHFDNRLFWISILVYLPVKGTNHRSFGCHWWPVKALNILQGSPGVSQMKSRQRSFFFPITSAVLLFIPGRDIFLHGFNGTAHFRELNYQIYGSSDQSPRHTYGKSREKGAANSEPRLSSNESTVSSKTTALHQLPKGERLRIDTSNDNHHQYLRNLSIF